MIKSKGEKLIQYYLDERGINYIPQKRFKNCKDKKPLPFDFYLPDENVLIEFDGKQHFQKNTLGNYDLINFHDQIKDIFAEKEKIPLIRINNRTISYINEIFDNLL